MKEEKSSIIGIIIIFLVVGVILYGLISFFNELEDWTEGAKEICHDLDLYYSGIDNELVECFNVSSQEIVLVPFEI